MGQRSLGLIETFGLLPGVIAADTAVKSANVELVGYEFAKGSGMTVVKVEGDVGAVKAAISAAHAAVLKAGCGVKSTRVIPRPAAGLAGMTRNGDTKGYTPPEPPAPSSPDDSGPEPDPDGGEAPEQEVPASEPAIAEVTTQDPTPAPEVAEEAQPEPVHEEPAPAEEIQPEPVPEEPAPVEEVQLTIDEPVVEMVSEPEPAPAEEFQPVMAETAPELAAAEVETVPAEAEAVAVSELEPAKAEAKKTRTKAQGKKKRS